MKDFDISDYKNPRDLLQYKGNKKISVVLPVLNEENTLGEILSVINDKLKSTGFVDEVIVMDGGSADNSYKIAVDQKAKAYITSQIGDPNIPSGKGTALWKSLCVSEGDIIVCMDSDIKDFDYKFIPALAAPLLLYDNLLFSKAYYNRTFSVNNTTVNNGYGGRVTEILVRPWFSLFYPELAQIKQPLAGEYAFKREVMENISFNTGFGVEVKILLEIAEKYGTDSICQVNCKERKHNNKDLSHLGRMAFSILHVLFKEAEKHGNIALLKELKKTYFNPNIKNFEEYVDNNIDIGPFNSKTEI